MALAPLLHRRLAFVAPPVQRRADLFRLLAERAAPLVGEATEGRFDAQSLLDMLEAREALQSTVLAEGIAFPHAIGDGLAPTLVGVARLDPPLPYDDAHPPVVLCFALFGDSGTPTVHVRTLARLARIVSSADSRAALISSPTSRDLLQRLRELDAQHP